MIEILAAAFLPPLVMLAMAWFTRGDFRRAALWFAALALLWFSPCWLTGRSPAPFDYLAEDVPPWEQPGLKSGNALLSDAVLQFLPWRDVVRDSILHGSMPFLNRYAAAGSPLWANPQAEATYALTWIGIPFSTFAWPLFAAMTKLLLALCGMYLFLRARGTSHLAAVAGSVAYAFCAFNIAFILFPHTNVSTLLPFVLFAIEVENGPLFAILLAVMLAGGHPESVLHCAVVALPYGIVKIIQTRRVVPIAAGGICALFLAAPALIPFAKLVPLSERVVRVVRQPYILTVPSPTLAHLAAFLTVAHLGATRDANALPNFNEMATQYAGALTFLLAVAAAVVETRRQRFWIAVFCVAAFFAFESPPARAILNRIPLVNVTAHGRLRFVAAFAVCVLAAAAIDRFIRSDRWRVALILLIYADLAAALLTYNPATSRAFFYPRRLNLPPGRVATVGNALRANTAAMLRREDIGFHDPMAFEPYGEVLARAGYDRQTYFNFFRGMPPRDLLDFLGVRSVVTPNSVWLNPTAKPRAFPTTPGAAVAILSYRPNGETIVVRAARPAHIVATDAALPGWTLTRDGEPWPLGRLGGVFLEFDAPPGDSTFELSYVPAGFTLGLALSLCGFVLLLLLVRLRNKAALASR